MIYRDRQAAGQFLADALEFLKGEKDLVILALPRGGVSIGYEVALRLNAPLDLIIPRKIGAPYNQEVAIGAVAEPDIIIWNEKIINSSNISAHYLEDEKKTQLKEISRRKAKYGVKDLSLAGKTIILVDDGIATGLTTMAAIRAVKKAQPEKIIVAVPVAPPDTIQALGAEVDQIICLVQPKVFWAVGQFYHQFDQVSDEQVIDLLQAKKQSEVVG